VYEEIPRKNAKTTKLAGIGLYMLTADSELGAEVYSAATKEEQARIVFDIAQQQTRMEPEFRARFGVEISKKALFVRDTASKFVPLAASDSLDGLNISCALIDELHAHKTRLVHDVLDSGTGARAQPLLWKITTAGSNRAGVCFDQRIYATKILNAVLKRHERPRAPGGRRGGRGRELLRDHLHDRRGRRPARRDGSWRKANPNWGISVDVEDFRKAAQIAAGPGAGTERVPDQAPQRLGQRRLGVDEHAAVGRVRRPRRSTSRPSPARNAWRRSTRRTRRTCSPRSRSIARRAAARLLRLRPVLRAATSWCRRRATSTWRAGCGRAGSARRRATCSTSRRCATSCSRTTGRHELREVPFDPAQLTQFATEMLAQGVPMVEIRPTVLNFSARR
jgi:hypothetical protein